MRKESKEFIESWELKLLKINSANDELKELFEKFTTLFTIYNRYYNEAFHVKKKEKRLQKQRYSDYEKATSLVIDFLGADNIIKSFNNNGNIRDIDHAYELINELFHINLADGISDIETDKQLRNNLKSGKAEIKSKAVLSLIYNVRCNIVHGYKNFKEHQRLIVEPLVNLLETLNLSFKMKFESNQMS